MFAQDAIPSLMPFLVEYQGSLRLLVDVPRVYTGKRVIGIDKPLIPSNECKGENSFLTTSASSEGPPDRTGLTLKIGSSVDSQGVNGIWSPRAEPVWGQTSGRVVRAGCHRGKSSRGDRLPCSAGCHLHEQ